MSIDRQLGLGFGPILGASILTAAVAVGALYVTALEKDELAHVFGERLASAERLRYRAEQVIATSRGFLITGADAYAQSFQRASDAFRDDLERLHDDLDPAERRDIESDWQRYLEAAKRAPEAGGASSALASGYFQDVLKPLRVSLEARIDRLVVHEREAFTAEAQRSNRVVRLAAAVVAFTLLSSLSAGLWLALSARRSLALQFERERAATGEAQRAAAARDEVLAVVSHDLRSPLGSILLTTQHLKRSNADRETLMQRVERIDLAARRMDLLIEELLDSALSESIALRLHRERCDLAPLVSEAHRLVEEQAGTKAITLSAVAPHVEAFVDRDRIARVLSNLLGNAIKFTPAGGEVSTKVDLQPGFVQVSVSDTGPGVPPDELPRLFEKHWRPPGARTGGLGLGLYIAKNLVEAHGGWIRADSSLGHGTTFTFAVPV